ncbi:transposase [Shigella dysenteriae 1012]|nr:transposase [Shigella dysenteriae 1012]
MMPLLDKLREQYGGGPLCSELHIAPSTYYHCQQQRYHPDKRSARAQRDDWLKKEIQRVYDEEFQRRTVPKMHAGCVKCSNAQNNRNNQEVAYTSLNS